jgi:hypothetical protein
MDKVTGQSHQMKLGRMPGFGAAMEGCDTNVAHMRTVVGSHSALDVWCGVLVGTTRYCPLESSSPPARVAGSPKLYRACLISSLLFHHIALSTSLPVYSKMKSAGTIGSLLV